MLQIEPRSIDELFLDPRNPRLGLRSSDVDLSQEEILARMRSWALEELAVSFVESGFWPQEALLCVKEHVYGEERLVVAEGNRRLAALKLLKKSLDGDAPSPGWKKIAEGGGNVSDVLFEEIPIIIMEDRAKIDIFLGYRHVTGIKEWAPAEKAEYISFLIDGRGLSYKEVMRKIGSKTDAVRRNYIAFQVYKQAQQTEDVDADSIIEKFSVLFLSLRTAGVQEFLGVDISAEPQNAKTPVPEHHVNNLREFVRWLFGQPDVAPIVQDSRQVDRFAKVLQSSEGLHYLRTSKRPSLDYAYVLAGGEEAEVAELIETAAFNVGQALSTIHLYPESERIKNAAERLISGVKRIESLYPTE